MSDRFDLMFKMVEDTQHDVRKIFGKLDDLPCGKNTEKISQLEKCYEKKSDRGYSFAIGLPTMLLAVLNIYLIIKK